MEINWLSYGLGTDDSRHQDQFAVPGATMPGTIFVRQVCGRLGVGIVSALVLRKDGTSDTIARDLRKKTSDIVGTLQRYLPHIAG